MVQSLRLLFISVLPLQLHDEIVYKFGVPPEMLDAFDNIARMEYNRLAVDNDFTLMELGDRR